MSADRILSPLDGRRRGRHVVSTGDEIGATGSDRLAAALRSQSALHSTATPPLSTVQAIQRSAGNAATARLLQVQRATVNTNGGVFDNGPMYVPNSAASGAVGNRVGASIMLDFIPGDLVEAPIDGIAMIQTVKSMTDRTPGAAGLNPTRNQGNTAVTHDQDDKGLVSTGGTAIDAPSHQPGRTHPNTSPLYFGVGSGAAAPATTLNSGQPTTGRTRRGSHVRNPVTGALDPPVSARTEDGPNRVIQVAGQTFEMNFEVAALVTAGPLTDTYLGSIEWGWQSDAAGTVTLKPFVPLASGAPTAEFMRAAGTWNAASFHDDSLAVPRRIQDLFGLTVNTVDLPITTLPSGVRAAVDMTTAALLARIPVVRREIAGLPAGTGVDRTNKEFELRALVAELDKRKIEIELTCNSISDIGSAAAPPEDEIWLALDGGGSSTIALTSTRTFRAGDSHTYQFAVSDFLPLSGPVHVEINEHDRAGATGTAHDDALITFDWPSPFTADLHTDRGGHYTALIDFDK